jgi:hypothetical protein
VNLFLFPQFLFEVPKFFWIYMSITSSLRNASKVPVFLGARIMESCLNQNGQNVQKGDKASDKTSSTSLPESCNLNLVSLSGQPEPRLLQRSDAPAVTDSSSSQPNAKPLPDAPMPNGVPCDPCNGKPEEQNEQTQTHIKSTKPSILSRTGINAGLLSYHPTDSTHQFNDLNYGVGLEFEKKPSLAFAAGEYRNSVRHNSYYGMVEYKPLHFGLVHAGVAGGAINGYPDMFHGKFFPAAMPVVSVEEKHVGANFVYIPSVKGVVPALSMQMKVRF